MSATAPAARLTARLRLVDARDLLDGLAADSVDALVTDPPYFLDKLGDTWSADAKAKRTTNGGQVTSLPAGMRFDPKQGLRFQQFMGEVAERACRALKPGGFLLSFTAPRLAHRLGVAVEDAGFHVRDQWAWLYTRNQAKAMSVERFVDHLDGLDDEERRQLRASLDGRKTPQVKSCLEPILVAQKPPEGTFLANWHRYGVGLVDMRATVGADGDKAPASVLSTRSVDDEADRTFLVPPVALDDYGGAGLLHAKPSKRERGESNAHLSVKPLSLMAQLIRVTTRPGALIVDPFHGSGSTGIAALLVGRHYLGADNDADYLAMSTRRTAALLGPHGFAWHTAASDDADAEGSVPYAGSALAAAECPDTHTAAA